MLQLNEAQQREKNDIHTENEKCFRNIIFIKKEHLVIVWFKTKKPCLHSSQPVDQYFYPYIVLLYLKDMNESERARAWNSTSAAPHAVHV